MINLYLISRSVYRTRSVCSWRKGWLLILLLLYAGWATAQFTVKETFTDTAVNPANPIVTGGIAKLTARAGVDPRGGGYLRLSEGTISQVAYGYIDKSFPSSLGVVLEFDFVMWGFAGNAPGDGISMWLFDGSISGSNFRIGPYGAPLAYYASCEADRNFYLSGGKIVCAMDYSGSFDYFSKNAGACPFPANVPDAIVIGGESSQSSHIATVGAVGLRYNGVTSIRPTESQYYRRVRMLVTKPDNTGVRRVVCYLKKSTDVLFTKIAEGNYTAALTPTLKVGFAGITGLNSQIQEVRNLYSTTADNLIVNTKVGESLKSIKDGDAVSWIAFVDNFAPVGANGAILQNSLPAGYTVQSSTKVGDVPAITNGIQAGPGERHTLSYFPSYGQVMTSYKGVMDNVPDGVQYVIMKAAITPPAGYVDNDRTNDSSADTLWMIRPDLVITQTMSDPALHLGSTRTLTLRVSNAASAGLAVSGGVTIKDTLPAGVLPNNIPSAINGWTVSVQGNVITATRADGLAVGAAYPDLALPIKISAGATPGTVRNGAGVRLNSQKELSLANSNTNTAYTIGAAGTLNGSVDRAAIAEDPAAGNAGRVTFQLNRSWPRNATVYWRIAGTAGAGRDYTANPAVQATMATSIAAGQTSAGYTFTATNDGLVEGNESIQVTIDSVRLADGTVIGVTGSPVNITLRDRQFQGTGGTGGNCTELRNPAGQVYYARVTKVQDGRVPGTPVRFRFTLDVASARDVTLRYRLAGTAVKGTHYNDPGNGTLIIGAGQTTREISLPVLTYNKIEDRIVEVNITDAKTTLTDGSCVQYGVDATTGKSTATISADRSKLVLSVKRVSDGAEPGTPARLSISLPAGISSGTDIKLVYALAGTARKGVDYRDPGALVLGAGKNSDIISIAVIDNKIIEVDRTIQFTLQTGDYTIDAANRSATVTIVDDDNTPANTVLSAGKMADAAEPATNGAFSISLPAGVSCSQPVTVSYTGGGTATSGADYTALSGTVVLPAGQNSIRIPLAVRDDKIIETLETVQLKIANGRSASFTFTAAAGRDMAALSIADDDNTPANTALSINKTADAGEPSTNGAFSINLPTGITCAEGVTINYSVGGTATVDSDYVKLSGTVLLPAGQNRVSVPVTVKDDLLLEPVETVALTIKGSRSASFIFAPARGKDTVTVLVMDDENSPAKRVLSISKTRDAGEPSTNGALSISLPEGVRTGAPITVRYTVTGTATADSDYVKLTGTAVIAAGQNSVTVPVTVKDDQILEGDETVVGTLSGGTGGGQLQGVSFTVSSTSGTVQLVIADDEDDDTPDKRAARQLCIRRLQDGAEGGAVARFAVGFRSTQLTASKDLRIFYSEAGSTAEADKDFEPFTQEAGVLSLRARQNSLTTDIAIKDDNLAEITERIVLTLTGVQSGYTNLTFEIGNGCDSAVMKIADNDALMLELTNGGAITEGETGTFMVAVKGPVQTDRPLQLKLAYSHNVEHGFTLEGVTLPPAYEQAASMPPLAGLQLAVQSVDNEVHDEAGAIQLKVQLGDNGDLKVSFFGSTESLISVRDNDPLLISWAGVPELRREEGSSGEYGKMPFHITMNRTCSRPVEVKYTIDNSLPGIRPMQKATLRSLVSGIMARLADVDDTKGDSQGKHTIVIAPGQLGVIVEMPILEDSIFELNEQFRLELLEGRMQLKSGQAGSLEPMADKLITGTILNDDALRCDGDYDLDGLPNWKEAGYASLDECDADGGVTEPVDTDGDGAPDLVDDDSDNDGVSDAVEKWTRDGRVVDNNDGKIRVHPGISPNGDGKGNERMYIENINAYPDNEVVLFNRWGDLIYKAKGYNNQNVSFSGRSNAGNRKDQVVPDGVYYYVIYLKAKEEIVGRYTGFIVIKR